MNQRRYIEHNLFLQSSNTKHINQVLHNVLLKSCSSLVKVLAKVLLKSCSSLAQVLLRSCETLAQNISPRNFNEFGNAFFYS